MKRISVFAIAASLLAMPAQASAPADAVTATPAVLTAANAVDPDAIVLARELVTLIYPLSDSVDYLRTSWAESLDSIENVSMRSRVKQEYERSLNRIEQVMSAHFPVMQEAYATAYAREFTANELRELIAFTRTPTGRHFVSDLEFADYDEAVLEANYAMSEEMEPIMYELQKVLCAEKTQARIAQGETDAKCPMA